MWWLFIVAPFIFFSSFSVEFSVALEKQTFSCFVDFLYFCKIDNILLEKCFLILMKWILLPDWLLSTVLLHQQPNIIWEHQIQMVSRTEKLFENSSNCASWDQIRLKSSKFREVCDFKWGQEAEARNPRSFLGRVFSNEETKFSRCVRGSNPCCGA